MLPLLRIREDLVGRLDLGKPILGRRILVCVGMKLLRKPVVCLLDFTRGCAFGDAKDLVGVFYSLRRWRCVEGLRICLARCYYIARHLILSTHPPKRTARERLLLVIMCERPCWRG